MLPPTPCARCSLHIVETRRSPLAVDLREDGGVVHPSPFHPVSCFFYCNKCSVCLNRSLTKVWSVLLPGCTGSTMQARARPSGHRVGVSVSERKRTSWSRTPTQMSGLLARSGHTPSPKRVGGQHEEVRRRRRRPMRPRCKEVRRAWTKANLSLLEIRQSVLEIRQWWWWWL